MINEKSWKNVEQFFQANKFLGPNETQKSREYSEMIRNATTTNIAKVLARQKVGGGSPWRTKLNPVITEYVNCGVTLRPDWESVKETIMYEAIVAKFTQNEDLKALLLATGDKLLVEHTKKDSYWGDGGDGTGQNRLGYILMKVRSELLQLTPKNICKEVNAPHNGISLVQSLTNKGATITFIGPETWIALFRNYLPPRDANQFTEIWEQHPATFKTIKMFGKDTVIPRYQQAYGNSYSYSGIVSDAIDVPDFIAQMESQLNQLIIEYYRPGFNMCLCNWYEPHHYIGAHSDDVRQLIPHSPIASLSWGCTRTFVLKPKVSKLRSDSELHVMSVEVHSGDLLIMGGKCQTTHTHEILKTKKKDPAQSNRINFTFRCFK